MPHSEPGVDVAFPKSKAISQFDGDMDYSGTTGIGTRIFTDGTDLHGSISETLQV